MPITAENNIPTMLISLIDQQDSGWVCDDTVGTAHEQRICAPGVLFVPNKGKRSVPILDDNGKTIGYKSIPIQYIKGCEEIDVEKQRKLGFRPDDKGVFNQGNSIPTEDAIVIKKGNSIIKREGDTALFDYLSVVMYNLSAPNRTKASKAIFKVVEVDKQTETLNEKDFLESDAVAYVQTLLMKQGKGYKYKEDKIDSLLSILGLYGGDTFPNKINTLTLAAKGRINQDGLTITTKQFLDIVTKLDETTITEVTHALQLDVIKFEGNSVLYTDGGKVLASLGDTKMKHNQKIEALSELLKTPEYAQSYQELKAKSELAQEKTLSV